MALAAAGACAVLLVALLREAFLRRRAEKRLASAQGELSALKSRPEKQEFRLERFELLWFPTVTASGATKTIDAVAPGLPHCRGCVLPLALDNKEWRCRQCAARHPESLADTAVLDSITQQALKHFQERHPGYRIVKT